MRDWTPTATDLEIYESMLKGKVIDLFVSINHFQIAAIRNSIWRLRRAGKTINTEMVQATNKQGEIKRYARYSAKQAA